MGREKPKEIHYMKSEPIKNRESDDQSVTIFHHTQQN